MLHQGERPVFLSDHHVQVAVTVHVQKLGGGELPDVDGVAGVDVGNGQGSEHIAGPCPCFGDVVEPMEEPEFIAHDDVEVAVAVQISKSGIGALDLEGGQRNPIVVHLVEARLIRGTDVAVGRHKGRGLVDALVPLLVGDSQVEQAVAVKIRQHRVSPTPHVDHVALEVGAVLKRPQRRVLRTGVFEPVHPCIVVGFEGGVGGEEQIFGAVEVHVEVERGREPRQVERLVAPQVGWEFRVEKHGAVQPCA